jgi:hypothetical protein
MRNVIRVEQAVFDGVFESAGGRTGVNGRRHEIARTVYVDNEVRLELENIRPTTITPERNEDHVELVDEFEVHVDETLVCE